MLFLFPDRAGTKILACTLNEIRDEALALQDHAEQNGVPHPLTKFARSLPLNPLQWHYANFLMHMITTQDVSKVQGANQFLLFDESQFPIVCELAGIDAQKLRNYLLAQAQSADTAND